MRLIQSAPAQSIRINEKGEVVLKREEIEGTHIVDLVNDVLRKRKSFSPRGWQEFAKLLTTLHPPRELVGNQDRWSFMQQQQHSPSDSVLTKTTELQDDKPDGLNAAEMFARADHLPPRKRRRPKRQPSPEWIRY